MKYIGWSAVVLVMLVLVTSLKTDIDNMALIKECKTRGGIPVYNMDMRVLCTDTLTLRGHNVSVTRD